MFLQYINKLKILTGNARTKINTCIIEFITTIHM